MTGQAADRLDLVLERARAAGCFGPGSPPEPSAVAEAREAAPLPPLLARVYARANGLLFDTLELFDPADWADINGDDELFVDLPGVVFIGSDHVDGFFFLDPGNSLGHGTDAVFWTDRSQLTPDEARLAAFDLAELIEQALDRRFLNAGPSVGGMALDALFETLGLHGDDVIIHAGYGSPQSLLAAQELDIPLSIGLIDFYERCDGFYVQSLELEIFEMKRLHAVQTSVTSSGVGALWLGRDGAGWRYAVTCGGWRDLPADRLLAVQHEDDIASAAILGRFSDVLRIFVETAERPEAGP